MKDDEVSKLFLKEIKIYLKFDLMQRDYAEQGIKKTLKKIKKECSRHFSDKCNTK